jgi:hypothetical protein
METKLPRRFWRVALWGVVNFLLFSVLFWYFLDTYIKFEIGKKEAFSSTPSTPFLPSIVAGAVALLLTALALAALWWLQTWRKPVALRAGFARHKGNAELCIWLLLLILAMVTSLSLPEHSHLATGRCALFSVDEACGHGPIPTIKLPSTGFYHISGHTSLYAGRYASGDKGLDKYGFDKFAFEKIEADRTRFGWPLQAITLDAVPQESEWHIIFEPYVAGNPLVWFLGWLILQAIISISKWLLRLEGAGWSVNGFSLRPH